MKILAKLNLANLKQNRARTIVTIVGIALSVALILAVIGTVTSLLFTIRTYAIDQYGDFHVMYENIPGDMISVIEESKHHKVQYYSQPVDYSALDEDAQMLYDYGYPYPHDSYAEITDANSIVRDASHHYNVYLKYDNAANVVDSENNSNSPDNLLRRDLDNADYDGDIETRTNSTIFQLDGGLPEVGRILLGSLATLSVGTLAIISAFVVRNSFSISITERVRQFGMLASIGTRPRQIRRMVYQEGGMVGLVAIPLGITLGAGATAIIVAIINNLVGSLFNSNMLFYISPSAILLTIVVGMIIIILSAASPAIVASRVSPIAALRNVQDVKLKSRKVRTPKLTQKIWGIGGAIAQKNLKRSRNKYRTTVVSIVTSIVVFIGIASFMSYGHETVNLFYEDTGANFTIMDGDVELYQTVARRFNVKEYGCYLANEDGSGLLRASSAQVLVVSRDEFARFASRAGYRGDDYAHQAIFNDYFLTIDSSGTIQYYRGTEHKVGDEIKIKLSRMVFDNVASQLSESEDADDLDAEERTDIYGINTVSQDIDITLTQVTDVLPIGESKRSAYENGTIYISEDNPIYTDNNEFFKAYVMHIKDTGLGEKISGFLDNESDVYYSDTEKGMRTIRNVILLAEILVYGFIITVSLIGVTNIFNTITTNIALRAKEFAILKSVGMTQKEFNHMIRLESVLYTTRALLIGLPIGLLVSYGVYKLFDDAMLSFGWLIPWWAIIVSIASVALLVAGIMRYSTRQIRKQNIIETIRKESF